MAEVLTTTKNRIVGRSEALDVGAAYAAISFPTSGGSTVFRVLDKKKLFVSALCTTQNADLKVQVRHTVDDAWTDLAAEVTVTAGGTEASIIYNGDLNGIYEMRIVAKDTGTAGAIVTTSFSCT